MKNKYIPLFAIFLFYYSCEKDRDQKSSVNRLIPDRTIYVAGSSYNSAGDMTACYWFDVELNHLVQIDDVNQNIDDWMQSTAKGLYIE